MPLSDEAMYAKGLYLQQHHLYKDAMKLYEAVARINPSHILLPLQSWVYSWLI